MSGSVKVLADSSAGISPQLARRWNVGFVPLTVSFGGRTLRDGIDLVPAAFYEELARCGSGAMQRAGPRRVTRPGVVPIVW
jgi:fatty acid-binding protein DegV